MSGGVSGPGGVGRTNLPEADPAATDALVNEMKATKGSGPSWMSFLDSDSSLKKLATQVLNDQKITAAEAKALVKDAKDYGRITDSEKRVFAGLLRDHAEKFEPAARDALSKFFNLPIGRPQIAADFPGQMRVAEGTSKYSFDDDQLTMTGPGKFSSTIKRDVYSAGYLPMKEGPMLKPLGTAASDKATLSEADNKFNKEKAATERLDEAMKRATGSAGKLHDTYKTEGKRDEADHWWGFCDRWAYNALDPEIAKGVNDPIYYKGMYFSTAELRGLATFTGRSDESGGMFDKNVTPLDLQKATTMFLQENGPGFIADVWLDSAHKKDGKEDMQVWNQPFHGVEQNVKELTGSELAKVLKDEFKLTGSAAEGKKVYYVETGAHYGMEVGDSHEGAGSSRTRNWKSYIVADANTGKALDGKWAKGSDEAPEYIWMPNRTGNHATREAKFFRDMIKTGVKAETVAAFERDIAALPAGPVSAQKKAELTAKYKGVGNAFPAGTLDAKLSGRGLKASDF